MSFLKTEWRKLAIANYQVPPDALLPYLPDKTELDLWQGRCYVSLVGFMFLKTKLLGVPIPFHRNFEEVNLRFYVKHHDGSKWKRGVVFIKEIVPKPILTLVANTVYKEHYTTHAMKHHWLETGNNLQVEYAWKTGDEWQSFKVNADATPSALQPGSEAEFITEHYWGYTKVCKNKTFEYEVTHPSWEVYPTKSHSIDIDFGRVYGSGFGFLNSEQPTSVMLAEGSTITVENRRRL